MSSSSIARRLLADRAGGPLAEMAIILLPFMLMLALALEGGNILWRHQIATKAVGDATRYLSRVQALITPDCGLDETVLAPASATAQSLAATGQLGGGGASLMPGLTPSAVRIPAPAIVDATPCTVVVSAIVDVQLALPFAAVFQLINPASPAVLRYSVGDQARWVGE